MSVFDPSMEPMVDMFIYETTTLLDQLDEILLESEKEGSMSEDHVNEVFRIMHTIKGSSAMMGLNEISVLAHRIEDMFYIIREDVSKLHSANGDNIFDILFRASDFLKAEVENIQQGETYVPASSAEMIHDIEREIAQMKGEAPAPAATPAPAASPAPVSEAEPAAEQANADAAEEVPAEPEEPEDDTHHVRVFFDDDCQMENIRAFMLMTQLKDCCETLSSEPEHPENNAATCSEITKNGFLIHLTLAPNASMRDVFNIIEGSVNIKSYTDETDGVAPEPSAQEPDEETQQQQQIAAAVAAINNEAPAQQAAQQTADGAPKLATKQSLVSVNQVKLDQLMDIMGEIVIAESMVSSNPDLKDLQLDNFNKSSRQLRKLTDQLQDIVMSIRMVPLNGVFQKMNRIVRDMNKKLGKEVELVTVGGDTEVDKTINDVLGDPFMHMIRNAMDHAIESPEERLAAGKKPGGTVTLSAQNIGGEIVITVADDGRGLNRESILKKAAKNGLLTKAETEYTEKEIFHMIMLPGFSTNEVVTEFSGRGVGMDVVRKNLEAVNGTLSVESQEGVGTTFTIKIPLTLAIVDGMVVLVGNDIFTIPITSIQQTFKLSEETSMFFDTEGNEMLMVRGECYPVIRLHSVYGIETETTDLSDGIFILVENSKKSACVFVDTLVGEQQVVVKPFPSYLNRYNVKESGLAGCTIMGDGSISLILDANNFLNRF